MRPTLRWLLGRGELHLRSLVEVDLDRPIRWVHISELDDPAQFLSGGELLLTTGKAAKDSPGHWEGYVRRLVERDVAGLGFGVGLDHEEVPAGLSEAAARWELPLISVPRPTPFIAVGEVVAAEIARAQEQAPNAALDAQCELIRVARSAGGPKAVIGQLGEALGAWVLLLDAEANVRHAAPKEARKHAARVRMDLDTLALNTPLQAASLAVAGDQVAILPIDVEGEVSRYLAAGRASALSPVERLVLTSAVGLIAWDLAGERETREAERRDRRAVLELAVAGHPELAETVGETLGVAMPAAPLRVAVIGCPRETIADLMWAAEEQHGLKQAGALVAQYDKRSVVVLLPVAEGDLRALEEVLHRVPRARGVVTEGVPLGDIPDGVRRARSVYFGTSHESERLVLARDVATAGLLDQLDTPAAQGWADALLEPLDRHAQRSKLDLVSTLRVFLANNGHVDASSAELGIHRHTLRYRLNRTTELLDCSLDDPTSRAELWLALRMRELR